jgi:hypothetical protein
VHTIDDTVISGELVLGDAEPRPAAIVARPDGAWLVGTLDRVPGRFPLGLRFHGRDLPAGVEVEIDADGTPSFG